MDKSSIRGVTTARLVPGESGRRAITSPSTCETGTIATCPPATECLGGKATVVVRFGKSKIAP